MCNTCCSSDADLGISSSNESSPSIVFFQSLAYRYSLNYLPSSNFSNTPKDFVKDSNSLFITTTITTKNRAAMANEMPSFFFYFLRQAGDKLVLHK